MKIFSFMEDEEVVEKILKHFVVKSAPYVSEKT
jgi:hypothetical protein